VSDTGSHQVTVRPVEVVEDTTGRNTLSWPMSVPTLQVF
jgi:hypothetical protein